MTKNLLYCLSRGHNNLDLFRLIAAVAVIYGHSFSLIPNNDHSDIFFKITGIYSAEWGVKTFFFMSGLLVVNSIITNKSPYSYVIKRAARIWPGLVFVVFGTAFVIGPLCTNLPVSEYFSNIETFVYVKKMLLFEIWGGNNIGLPGVFEINRSPNVVNAPLWTLSVEFFACILILGLYLIGAFDRRIAWIFFILFLADALWPSRLIFWWLPKDNSDFSYITFCFAICGLLAVYKSRAVINFHLILGAIILSLLFKGWMHQIYLVYATMFLLVLWLATLPQIIKLPKFPDISYGVYLWGWPIQQSVVNFFPNLRYWISLSITLIAVFLIAYVSWRFIEKPSISMGKKLINRIELIFY
jgi:peptidoglycan/LPS O-acetylase OafA/YrhL